MRLRAKGGHGGHNGMRSIISQLANSQEFPRIRVGARSPEADSAFQIIIPSFSEAANKRNMLHLQASDAQQGR